MTFAEIERELDDIAARVDLFDPATGDAPALTAALLRTGEAVLEQWIVARDQVPTDAQREGFRLIALHRQGCKGEPSFNACRETCRELCYYHNLIAAEPDHTEVARRLKLATLVARHLFLFVSGKMEVENLGDFCCSSRPVRSADAAATEALAPD